MNKILNNNFTEKYNILYSIVVNNNAEILNSTGDLKKLKYKDIYQQLFLDNEGIQNLILFMSNEKDHFFKSWKQGEVKCIVYKLPENRILGLFYHDKTDVLEGYKFQKELILELQKQFNPE